MDTLLELAAILDRKRLSKIDVLDKTFLSNNNNDLYYRFYSGLVTGKFTNDKVACHELYGIEKPDHRYRMLKSRLKRKMYNTLLLIDPNDYFNNNLKNRKYFECISTLIKVEILVKIKGTNISVIELIKDNYKEALDNKFYDILKTYSYYLLLFYSLSGDDENYQKELIRFRIYKNNSDKELSIKQLNSQITLYLTIPRVNNENFIREIEKQLILFNELVSDYPDPEAMFYYYHSLLGFIELTADYNKLLEVTNKLEALFIKYPFIASIGRKNLIITNRLKVYLHLKQYENGFILFQNSSTLFLDEGSYNWFTIKEYEYQLYLHTQNISECFRVYNQVIKNKFFKRRFEHLIERWKIYEAFLVFLDSYKNKGDYKFPVAKFINSVPFYTKDKSGFNFTIKLIEILFLFARKQYNIIFAKTDALKIYRTRYLNDDTYIRSRLFLNALLKAEKDGFNAKKMKAGYPEIEQLNNKEKQLIIADWEILPYEMVWDILTDLARE